MRIVVLADTHLPGDVRTRLSATLLDAMSSADLVLHAGDVNSALAFDQLAQMNELRAVLGNNDSELTGILTKEARFDLDGVRFAMLHDAGARIRRPERLHQRFPDAQVVVYGHSHVPDCQIGVDGQLLFNPGSPTQRRSQPHTTFGRIEISDGLLSSWSIEDL